VNKTNVPEGIVLLDSLGDLHLDNTYPILVCGSHCGGNKELARQVKNCQVKAVFLNNAGIGKNQAGIKGLMYYNDEHVVACAVDNQSAEIGIAQDTWENGIISHANTQAQHASIRIGDSVQEAVNKIIHFLNSTSTTPQNSSSKHLDTNEKDTTSEKDLKQQKQSHINGIAITVTDSITFLNKNNAGEIVVCGSHGGISAGLYAQKHGVKAVFFNDAGIGKNNAGVKSLESLSQAGILACTVDCLTAEIFNGQDTLDNGIISLCNQVAKDKNIKKGMTVKEAIACI
jgi:uncharacterized protein YunC (DUF1805 family)